MTQPTFVHRTIIETTAERLWQALIDGEMTRQYYFQSTVEGRPEKGGRLVYRNADGSKLITADVLDADPPRRLDMTFQPHFMGDEAPVSRHVFEIKEMGRACLLIIEHYEAEGEALASFGRGWVLIASQLKTLLETGRPMEVAYEDMDM